MFRVSFHFLTSIIIDPPFLYQTKGVGDVPTNQVFMLELVANINGYGIKFVHYQETHLRHLHVLEVAAAAALPMVNLDSLAYPNIDFHDRKGPALAVEAFDRIDQDRKNQIQIPSKRSRKHLKCQYRSHQTVASFHQVAAPAALLARPWRYAVPLVWHRQVTPTTPTFVFRRRRR